MSNTNFENLFSALSDSASILNTHSDSCNKIIKDTQDRLVSLNIGLEYWLNNPIFRSDQKGDIGANDNSTEIIKRFGFSRLNGNWMLSVKTVRCVSGFYQGEMDCPYTNEYVDKEPEPLLDAPREIRLTALKYLPEFLDGYNQLVQKLNSDLAKN
ncbi:hypothetical protein PEC730217_28110 [Pectobacterium carotovorum subsp. carotovorum]|nr:hypothetical protein PEC730217_28110 [Pectobacterium carotovorum subsp. carotovorum]